MLEWKKAACLFFVLVFVQACLAVEIENSLTVGPARFNVVIEGYGEITGDLKGNDAKIEILSFGEMENQNILSLNESFVINGKSISPERASDEWGNNYAVFNVGEIGSFTYRVEALIETGAKPVGGQDFDLANKINEFPEYVLPSENIQSNHESIRTVAFNRFESTSFLETVADITQWTYDSLEYDLSFFPETTSALETLQTKKGVCDEFAVLAASMLRAKEIPTRVVTGLAYNPQNEIGWNNHAWLETFNPRVGWIPLDPTFGEAGSVDGTHIARGVFPDPKMSTGAKVTSLQTAPISIEENQAVVEIESIQMFDNVFSVKANKIVMPTNKWYDLKVNVKNESGGMAIGWFSLIVPKDFLTGTKRKILVFEVGEEKELVWESLVGTPLKENEYLSGDYRIVGLGVDTREEFEVVPGETFEPGARLKLLDVLPIVDGSNLLIELTIENMGPDKADAIVEIANSKQSFEIGGFQRISATVTVSNVENTDYNLFVNGPGLNYETTITIQEGKPLEKPVVNQEENSQASQNIELPAIPEQLFSLEAGIIAGIVIGIIVILLLLKELLLR